MALSNLNRDHRISCNTSTTGYSLPHIYPIVNSLKRVSSDDVNKVVYPSIGGFMCPRDEEALAECLKDGLNVYIPELATGLPKYGIPPCEPLFIPALTIQQSSGPISVTSTYKDVTVRGPSAMRITNVSVDSRKHEVTAKLYIPEFRMKGHYSLSGKLLLLPIEGDGTFSAKYGDIDAVLKITLGRVHREGAVDALACEKLDVKFNVGTATMKLENLFGGDNELGNTMNMFLNENWEKLAKELQEPMEEALRDFLKPLADHAFSTLNADDIFLT
ncbi:protein takeout-like [Battus philenor]|uniref:protein takeout-like n=1 Tax=Battus philenor TaxID=42288 RepID=UPI0035CF9AF2